VDPMLLLGLLASAVAIVVAVTMDGNSFGVLVGPSSAVMVVGGTLGVALTAYRLADIKQMPKALIKALRGKAPDPDRTVTSLASLAETARREGMLAMEAKLEELDDEFLRTGAQLLVDGLDGDQVREVLSIDIAALDERHQTAIGFFKSLGQYSPSFGMAGTVIGLINMLQNLSDPSQLGLGMAMALLTTLYGVMFANLVYNPLAAKLTRLNELELAARDIAVDGLLSVQAGASPRMLVDRLETYLPPECRIGIKARAGGEGASADATDAEAA
jgi:chemotaxis protein MotA